MHPRDGSVSLPLLLLASSCFHHLDHSHCGFWSLTTAACARGIALAQMGLHQAHPVPAMDQSSLTSADLQHDDSPCGRCAEVPPLATSTTPFLRFCSTAAEQHSSTAAQQHSSTAAQQHTGTARVGETCFSRSVSPECGINPWARQLLALQLLPIRHLGACRGSLELSNPIPIFDFVSLLLRLCDSSPASGPSSHPDSFHASSPHPDIRKREAWTAGAISPVDHRQLIVLVCFAA